MRRFPRPQRKRAQPGPQRHQAKQDDRRAGRREDEHPPSQGYQVGHRIQPDAERAFQIRPIAPQQGHGDDLAHELDEDARGDERVDDHAERQRAGDDGDDADEQQRDVGEALLGMDPGEDAEEGAVGGRRIRDARVAEQQREDRPERGPQHQERKRGREARPVDPLHEDRDDEVRLRVRRIGHELAPWDHADDRQVDGDVDDGDGEHADQDGARDDSAGVPHFVADVTDVVVAQVVVDAHARRRAETEEEPGGEVEGSLWKVEGDGRVEVERAGDDHGQRREEGADPQRDRERADGIDAPVEQRDVDDADQCRQPDGARARKVRQDVPRVVGKADVAGGDFERAAQDELPDEQERHQAAEPFRPEAFAQVAIGAARSRQHGAELGPDHAVSDDDDQRDQPPQQGLRAAERRHQQRDRDERPDADHVAHVQSSSLQQAETALELGGGHRAAVCLKQPWRSNACSSVH